MRRHFIVIKPFRALARIAHEYTIAVVDYCLRRSFTLEVELAHDVYSVLSSGEQCYVPSRQHGQKTLLIFPVVLIEVAVSSTRHFSFSLALASTLESSFYFWNDCQSLTDNWRNASCSSSL